jgi:hypothetical protein
MNYVCSCASVILDGADCDDIDSPHFPHAPKSWEANNKLKTKWAGVLWHGAGTDTLIPSKLYLYCSDDRTKRGGDFWVTTFMHNLVMEEKRRRTLSFGKFGLPPVIYIQSDNTSKDLKNWAFATLLEAMTKSGKFSKVKFCFLPVGHTHEDIDAVFGRLSQSMRKMLSPIRTFKECAANAIRCTTCTHEEIFVLHVGIYVTT